MMEKKKMQPKAAEVVKAKKKAIEAALPSSIQVLGKTFEVQICNLKGIYGDCNVMDRKIRIHQAQTVESAQHTLWHESIHAALGISGLTELLDDRNSNLEEAIVRCIEHAFSDIVDLKKLSLASLKNDLTNDTE